MSAQTAHHCEYCRKYIGDGEGCFETFDGGRVHRNCAEKRCAPNADGIPKFLVGQKVMSDSVMYMSGGQVATILHLKADENGQPYQPYIYLIKYEDGQIALAKETSLIASRIDPAIQSQLNRAVVLGLIVQNSGQFTSSDIAALTGLDHESVRLALVALRDDGMIYASEEYAWRVGGEFLFHSKYALTTPEQQWRLGQRVEVMRMNLDHKSDLNQWRSATIVEAILSRPVNGDVFYRVVFDGDNMPEIAFPGGIRPVGSGNQMEGEKDNGS